MKRLIIAFMFLFSNMTWAGLSEYYIGLDTAPLVTSGDYTGLPNPNKSRLTFLLNHGDHFHGIGRFDYSGVVGEERIVPTNTNNRLPETYANLPPLPLTAGEGELYLGKLVSKPSDLEYSRLQIRAISSLKDAPVGSDAEILYNSSNKRYANSLANATIALQLVSKSEGLNIGTKKQVHILKYPGDFVIIKPKGTEKMNFTPVFWTEANAEVGTYSAEFRLLDISDENKSRSLPSGTFNFDFAVSPQ
ncbi:all3515 family Zur-repressed PEP-CTERM protein [Methylocucumis oryzae]|uniref:all3515 family Zur-repressed PEP-CTERM protein n=1 Tax=Methylocucumis oryzae TaxID=1632867 RepID=UPI000697D731|nr:all3515 family Zur-repressed PEP-CTERM protein [Methylocucumis oryzae]